MTTVHERRRDPRSGFTLIEIVLALCVAGFLFTGVFWTLDQAVVTRNGLSNLATPYVVGPAVLDVIAEDLANLYFYDLKENNAFYGSNAELLGREADALSFIALSKAYAPEVFGPKSDQRYSFANEISYALRRGAPGTPFLELWRREDYFVDDAIHQDGDYVLLYDKVHSLSIQYVSRNPQSKEGVAGSNEKTPEQMLQDGWNSIEEQGVPRALQVTLSIYAQDSEEEVDRATASDRATVYTFKRFLTLPQVHMILESEQKIASWDGKFQEARELFVRLSLAPRFEEFLTVPAYELVTSDSIRAETHSTRMKI